MEDLLKLCDLYNLSFKSTVGNTASIANYLNYVANFLKCDYWQASVRLASLVFTVLIIQFHSGMIKAKWLPLTDLIASYHNSKTQSFTT